MKIVRVTMPDGSRWEIPASEIAVDQVMRQPGKIEPGSEKWYESFAVAMEDLELKDWLRCYMTWDSVQGVAVQVEPPEPTDYNDALANDALIEVMERE